MNGKTLATVRITKDGQTYVVNQADYRHPDNTVREQWKGWKIVGEASADGEVLEARAKAEADKEKARKDADARLVDEVPTGGSELLDYIAALPNKGAVQALGSKNGLDIATAEREAMNLDLFEQMTAGQEGSDAE